MYVRYAIPCRHIEALADGSWVAVGMESVIRDVLSMPSLVSAPLFISLGAGHLEATSEIEHRLTVSVRDPDLNLVAEPMINDDVRIVPGPQTPPGWEVQCCTPMFAAFIANMPGIYSIDVAADDNDPAVISIIVRLL